MQKIQNISQDHNHADMQKLQILFFSKYASQADKIQKKKAANAENEKREAENQHHMEVEEEKIANNAIQNNPNSGNEAERQMFYPPLGYISASLLIIF